MAVSSPVISKEIRPDVGSPRMNSMGSYKMIMDPEALVLPNYLRASIGSCHDICKFGRKRDFTMETRMETRTIMPGKLPVSPNKGREPNKSNDMKKKNSLFCTSRSPSTVRNPACQVKAKEIQPGEKKLVANAKNPQKLKMKPLEKKGAPNGGWNYGISGSKQTQNHRGSKKSISVPKTGSLAHKPEVRKVLKKASCSKNKETITKADIEPASVEDIPEKILFITELNSENQAVGLNPEEKICDDSLIDASLLPKTEDENYVDKEIDSVQFSTCSSSSKESNDSQSHEWDNSTGSSSSSSTAETRSPNMRTQDVYNWKPDGNEEENEMNNVVLRHQNVDQKRSTEGLFNGVIEETAKKQVNTRKGVVKALVHAFETVISLQDLSLPEQFKCGDPLPKFPLCVD